jgi:SAM-dependent methyltransferase/tetratricopeptide (TPR) repeat protein
MFANAVAHHNAGALAEAERDYRRLLAQAPDHAAAQSRMGAVLMAQGRVGEAIAYLKQALELDHGLFEAHGNLAQAYMAVGQMELAVHVLARALEIQQTPQGEALFADWIKTVRFKGDVDPRIHRLVVRALTEGWAKPRELTDACISLIKCGGAVNGCIKRAEAAWPARLAAAELFGPSGAASVFADPLLCRLLESDPITDIGLERFLTNVRLVMLERARSDESPAGERELEFFGAVARQCFINEYLYPVLDTEADHARELQSALSEKIAANAPIPPLWPLVAGAYGPLVAQPGAERLCNLAWPRPVAAVITQQISEPLEERRLAATMPALTSIDDAVSRAVRQQYEENPYPRWAIPSTSAHPRSDASTANPPRDVLIAGCGTGLSTAEFAQQMRQARVLAVDLSLASLSYAKRMTQRFGLTNVEFAQADIIKLGSIGRSFDFIDCSGVLHHMGDPWQGWRVLLSLLRPGGSMQVGLYSGLARRDIVAARALITQRGYRSVAQDIRRCREDIVTTADPLLRAVADRHDFYTMSECRDLLFHVQEHRITLPEIKSFVAANNLKFAGFMLDPGTMRRFAERFRDAAAFTDLDCWQKFEGERPTTFANMYCFQVTNPLP